MTKFNAEWAEWLRLSASDREQDFDRCETLEARLLEHRPTSIDDARRILDVVIAQADPRSDGRDWAALKRIRSLLLSIAGEEGVEPARAAA